MPSAVSRPDLAHIHPISRRAKGSTRVRCHLAVQPIGHLLVVPAQADRVPFCVAALALRRMHKPRKAALIALGMAECVIGHAPTVHREQQRGKQAA